MKKIVFFNIPAQGHTNPTLGVVRELVARVGANIRRTAMAAAAAPAAASAAVFSAFTASTFDSSTAARTTIAFCTGCRSF